MKFAALFFAFAALSAEAKTISLGNGVGEPEVVRVERFQDTGKTLEVRFHLKKLVTEYDAKYEDVKIDSLPLTSEVGMPALPFQSIVVDAAAGELTVSAVLGEPVIIDVGRVRPAQVPSCRCARPSQTQAFVDHLAQYTAAPSGFRVESLGDYRGQSVSRVLLFPHKYDPKTGSLAVYPNARFVISMNASEKAKGDSIYDYLVIAPRDFTPALGPWLDWKRSSQNLRFNVVAYEDLGSPGADGLKAWIHAEYARARFKYALLVGSKSKIPQESVETSTDQNTPSDLPYFTMGGDADVIPDVLAGRVVAGDAGTLTRVLKKWMDYERDVSGAAPGWARALGVASNQKGSGPSDLEYVTAVQDKLKATYATSPITLYQSNADSTPANFNAQLAAGAMWVTYVGHGSGISWPSFGVSYELSDIAAIRNANSVKPIWIDVACLNGTLEAGGAGASLVSASDPSGAPTGVTAYLGGTVLVSWDPPAIFARGVAFEMAGMVQPILGEVIQAGQRYLAENTSNALDIASNQRWYHLQGDPSMRLRLK